MEDLPLMGSLITTYFGKGFILKEQKEKFNGIVIESLPGTTFMVELEDGRKVLSYLAGKMRLHYIKVMPGDKVAVELSPDGLRGRITFRF